jgi:hypothetical protein
MEVHGQSLNLQYRCGKVDRKQCGSRLHRNSKKLRAYTSSPTYSFLVQVIGVTPDDLVDPEACKRNRRAGTEDGTILFLRLVLFVTHAAQLLHSFIPERAPPPLVAIAMELDSRLILQIFLRPA